MTSLQALRSKKSKKRRLNAGATYGSDLKRRASLKKLSKAYAKIGAESGKLSGHGRGIFGAAAVRFAQHDAEFLDWPS